DVNSRKLEQLTGASTDVVTHDLSPDGSTILYSTALPVRSVFNGTDLRYGLVVSSQDLSAVLTDRQLRYPDDDEALNLYVDSAQSPGQPRQFAENVPVMYSQLHPPKLSPDGTLALVLVRNDSQPEAWRDYVGRYPGEIWPEHYVLFDTRTGKSSDLLNAPV